MCPQGRLKVRTLIGGDHRRHLIQPCKRACATASAVIVVIGMACESIGARKYLNPSEGNRGPMRSMWTRSNRAPCRCGECQEQCDSVTLDFGLLTLEAGASPFLRISLDASEQSRGAA